MSASGRGGGEIVEFLDVLRRHGYNLSTEQYVAAQRLLVILAASGDWLALQRKLGTLLAPVLCTSREEQEDFPRLYGQWLGTRPRFFAPTTRETVKLKERLPLPPPDPETNRSIPEDNWRFLPAVILVAAVLVWLAIFIYQPGDLRPKLNGVVTDEQGQPIIGAQVLFMSEANTPISDATTITDGSFSLSYTTFDLPALLSVSKAGYETLTVEVTRPGTLQITLHGTDQVAATPSFYEWWRAFMRRVPPFGTSDSTNSLLREVTGWVMLGVAVLFPLLVWLRRIGRGMELKRWRTKNKLKVYELGVKGAAEQLTGLMALRRTAQEMRRHRHQETQNIDIGRTVEKTIREGLFAPAYAPRKALPEYLVLIDRASFNDQHARLVNEVLERLISNDVFIERFFFQGDPRLCRKSDAESQFQTLKSLAAQYPDYHLVVFSDGAGLFNPFTGRPQRWIEMFSPWTTRVFLTPEFKADDYRQMVLSELGFSVLPANKEGLLALGDTVDRGAPPKERGDGKVPPLPELLRVRSGRWLESVPPAPGDLKELSAQLRSFLGAGGYLWLTACAVYPMLLWELTLYLGYRFAGGGKFDESFSRLVRLPWFRHGHMPDWLREFLIFELSPEQEQAIRESLEELLRSSLTRPEGFVLPLACVPEKAEMRLWERVRGRLARERKFFRDFVRTEPDDSPLRDYVLVDFMSGRKPNRLAVKLPDELRAVVEARKQATLDLYLDTGFFIVNLFFFTLLGLAFVSTTPTYFDLFGSRVFDSDAFGPILLLINPFNLAVVWSLLHILLGSDEVGISVRDNLAGEMGARQLIVTVTSQQDVSSSLAEDIVATHDATTALSSLHQLPPPPADFTGRKAELAELLAQRERDGEVTIYSVQGMGGVGKTTLAIALAHRLRSRYPDAQLYLDLKGTSNNPLSVADALAHVIRSYSPTAPLPEDERQLRGLYLSLLKGQRALLLLDDARNVAQVEAILPPAGCALIVTSRRRFKLPGMSVISPGTLSPEDARTLLLQIAPRIGEDADVIADLCGRLPLALRVAASTIAARPSLSVADFVRRLADGPNRLELVDASLKASYEMLDPELQRIWVMLSVFPDTFDAAAAAAVWKVEENTALDRLSELNTLSLVEWNEPDSLFRLHELARQFATQIKETRRSTAYLRHSMYYLRVLEEADNLYKQGGKSQMRGLALFDLEWRNIQAGQAWAEKHAGQSNEAAKLCSDYAAVGAHLLSLRQPPRERIRWLEAALSAAQRLNDRAVVGIHLGNLGACYAGLGKYRRAIKLMEEHLEIVKAIDNPRGVAQALGNLGNIYINSGELQRAIELHEQALAINQDIGDRRGEGQNLGDLGAAYATLGQLRRAIDLYEAALVITREIGDRFGETNVSCNLGLAYSAEGETHHALELYEHGLAIAREIGNRRGEGVALGNISLAFDKLGDQSRAEAFARAALEIFELIESPLAGRVRERLERLRSSELGSYSRKSTLAS